MGGCIRKETKGGSDASLLSSKKGGSRRDQPLFVECVDQKGDTEKDRKVVDTSLLWKEQGG